MLGLAKNLATGVIKSGTKKIAADKLLNRKKKPVARKPTLDELIADVRGSEDSAKGGALAVRPTTSLVPSFGGDIQKFTGREGEYGSVEDNVIRIKSKVIAIDGILKNTLAAEKARKDRQRKAQEQADAVAAESNLEGKKKKKKGPTLGKFVPKVAKNAFEKLKTFFSNIVLGYVAIQLLPLLPALIKFVQGLSAMAGFLTDTFLIPLIDNLTTFVDFGYKLYDMAAGFIKNLVGEEGAKKIEQFMGVFKDLFQGFLVFKIIGEKILKSIIQTITRAFRIARIIVKRALRFGKNIVKGVGKGLNVVKNVGGKALNLGKNVLGKTANLTKNVGGKALNVGKNLLGKGANIASKSVNIASKGAGILSKGAGVATEVAKKGAAKVGGFATKIFGKAAKILAPALKTAMPAVKGFARRIPILGPIIVGLVSMMTGDPVDKALFKAGGAALGGALGTFIPIPVLGTLIGETVGVYVGDVLHELIMGGGMAAAGQKLKDDFGKLLSGGEKVFGWLKDGFGRFMEGLPKNPLKLGGFILNPFNIGDKAKLIGKAFFSRDPMNPEKDEKDVKDTNKGEVKGKTPPLPKTNKDGTKKVSFKGNTNKEGYVSMLQSGNKGKIEQALYEMRVDANRGSGKGYSDMVGNPEFAGDVDLIMKHGLDKVTIDSGRVSLKGNANNIIPMDVNAVSKKTNNISQYASYEDGAEEVVLLEESSNDTNKQSEMVESTKILLVPTGSTEDAYESLYVR